MHPCIRASVLVSVHASVRLYGLVGVDGARACMFVRRSARPAWAGCRRTPPDGPSSYCTVLGAAECLRCASWRNVPHSCTRGAHSCACACTCACSPCSRPCSVAAAQRGRDTQRAMRGVPPPPLPADRRRRRRASNMRYATQQRAAWHAQGGRGGGGRGGVPAASIRMLANQVCACARLRFRPRPGVVGDRRGMRARARCTEHGGRGRVRRLGCAVKDLRVGDVVVYQSPIDHQKTVIKRIAALVGTVSASISTLSAIVRTVSASISTLSAIVSTVSASISTLSAIISTLSAIVSALSASISTLSAIISTLSAHGCGATPERAPGGAACVHCRGSPWSPARSPRASPRALTSGNRTANKTAAPRANGSPGADVGGGGPSPGAAVAGVGPVPADMRHGCAKSRCRGGRRGHSASDAKGVLTGYLTRSVL